MHAVDALLTVEHYERISHLALRAPAAADGRNHGKHRGRFAGQNAEFAAHRQYVPGDDLRSINWALYARQRRLHVKQYDADTNASVYLLLDISRSMECATQGISKLTYGVALALSLAHLALGLHDAVGLTLFADGVHGQLVPSTRWEQIDAMRRLFTDVTIRPTSNARHGLRGAVERTGTGGIVFVISDLFDDYAAVTEAFDLLRIRRHAVTLLQLFDPVELQLSVHGGVLFRDLETGDAIKVNAEAVRGHYLQAAQRWRTQWAQACHERSVSRFELTSAEPLHQALTRCLEL